MKYLIFAIFWTLLISALLLYPSHSLPQSSYLKLIHFDKIVHIGLFTILSLSFLLCFRNSHLITKLIIIFLCCLYGIILEFVQEAFPSLHRGFEILDMLFNAIGVLLGVFIFKKIENKLVKSF